MAAPSVDRRPSISELEVQSHRNPITLTRWILQEQQKHPEAQGDLTILLQSVQLACKVISNAMAKAGVANLYGVAGGTNTTGDAQKKLDVFSNECFINCMTFSQKVSIMVSEENEEPIFLEHKGAKYSIAFDPLDGSSNIDANVSVGTIFGIWKVVDSPGPNSLGDVLRPGSELCAAGYALYGAATMMVLCTGQTVNGFTLDPSLGEFILTHENIKIPRKGKIYSINEGNSVNWNDATRAWVDKCKNPQSGSPKSLRYIGSMVADVHRTLLYGGVFAYPGDNKSRDGKLRLLYEAAPMAFLMEKAGGAATTGKEPIRNIVPTSIHQRAGVFMGSLDDIAEVEECFRQAAC